MVSGPSGIGADLPVKPDPLQELPVAERRKARYHQGMGEENVVALSEDMVAAVPAAAGRGFAPFTDDVIAAATGRSFAPFMDNVIAAPAATGRSFAPFTDDVIATPAPAGRSFAPLTDNVIAASVQPARLEPATASESKAPPSGIPGTRVDIGLVLAFAHEIDAKVTVGRQRMRWFANHLIVFAAGVAVAMPLHLWAFADIEPAYALLPLAAWIGVLAVHAHYAMNPILRRSPKESQLRALLPPRPEKP